METRVFQRWWVKVEMPVLMRRHFKCARASGLCGQECVGERSPAQKGTLQDFKDVKSLCCLDSSWVK